MAEPPLRLNPITAGVRRALALPSNLMGGLGRPVAAALLGTLFTAGSLGLTGTANAQERNGAPLPPATVAEMPIGASTGPDGTPRTTTEVSDFDPHRLREYGLYQLFWNTHGDPDLAGGGLNEISLGGAQKLYDYAKTHDLNGRADNQGITAGERDFIKALLEHPHYSAFFELDAKAKLLELFEIQPDAVHTRDVNRPTDVGTITLPYRVSKASTYELNNVLIGNLGSRFTAEYESRKAELEGTGTPEEKSARVLGLFRDYAKALWSHGELPGTDQAGQRLLDALERTRSGLVLGAQNYNGAPWSAAQGLVLGVLDPNTFPTDFPTARSNAPTTYLAMNEGMANAMKYMDQYRVASGMQPGAEAHERRSPIGYVIGEPNGHNKAGSLSEARPFATSGLNWGIALFPGDREIRDLKPKAGFEFPIDALDRFGYFLRLNPSAGERLGVVDQAGRPVRAEKVIERDETGKATAWSAKFYGQDGQELQPSEVMGVFLSSSGTIKGDRKATGTVTCGGGASVIATRLSAPQVALPDPAARSRDHQDQGGRQDHRLPQGRGAEADRRRRPGHGEGLQSFTGFRFDDEPQTIKLKNGQTLQGRVKDLALDSGPGVTRLKGDLIAIHDAPGRPMLGTLELDVDGSSEMMDVRKLDRIEQKADGTITAYAKDGWPKSITGKLLTEVPWAKAETVEGTKVLKQTDDFVVTRRLHRPAGRRQQQARHRCRRSREISGESQKDMRLSQYMVWVGHEPRHVRHRRLDRRGGLQRHALGEQDRHGGDRRRGAAPKWAPKGDLAGIEGRWCASPATRSVGARACTPATPPEPTSDQLRGLGAGVQVGPHRERRLHHRSAGLRLERQRCVGLDQPVDVQPLRSAGAPDRDHGEWVPKERRGNGGAGQKVELPVELARVPHPTGVRAPQSALQNSIGSGNAVLR
jgi:hypothetical protein